QRDHARDPDGARRQPGRAVLDAPAGGHEESEMNRRKFVKTAALAPLAAAPAMPAAAPSLTPRIVRLNLQHTWTTTMSSSQYRDTLHVAYAREGITGHGEGAPIVRYHEDAEGARKAVESMRLLLLSSEPMQFAKIMSLVFKQ